MSARPTLPVGSSVSIVLSSLLKDGDVVLGCDPAYPYISTLFVGTRRLTEVEYAGQLGRYIVRAGMADVLAWLGEEVGPEPVYEGRGRAFLDSLRNHTTPSPEGARP